MQAELKYAHSSLLSGTKTRDWYDTELDRILRRYGHAQACEKAATPFMVPRSNSLSSSELTSTSASASASGSESASASASASASSSVEVLVQNGTHPDLVCSVSDTTLSLPRCRVLDATDGLDSNVSLLVTEMKRFRDEFTRSQTPTYDFRPSPLLLPPAESSRSNADIIHLSQRKTKEPVLAVLLVQRQGHPPKLHRGTNMEASAPGGPQCAEWNAICNAVRDDATLSRRDLSMLAVYSAHTSSDQTGLRNDAMQASQTMMRRNNSNSSLSAFMMTESPLRPNATINSPVYIPIPQKVFTFKDIRSATQTGASINSSNTTVITDGSGSYKLNGSGSSQSSSVCASYSTATLSYSSSFGHRASLQGMREKRLGEDDSFVKTSTGMLGAAAACSQLPAEKTGADEGPKIMRPRPCPAEEKEGKLLHLTLDNPSDLASRSNSESSLSSATASAAITPSYEPLCAVDDARAPADAKSYQKCPDDADAAQCITSASAFSSIKRKCGHLQEDPVRKKLKSLVPEIAKPDELASLKNLGTSTECGDENLSKQVETGDLYSLVHRNCGFGSLAVTCTCGEWTCMSPADSIASRSTMDQSIRPTHAVKEHSSPYTIQEHGGSQPTNPQSSSHGRAAGVNACTGGVNPRKPCGACLELLKKVAEASPEFSVITFAGHSLKSIYLQKIRDK